MSVIVKGMEMPKNCFRCRFKHSGISDYCTIEDRDFDAEVFDALERDDWHPDWCPLRPLPEKHGGLIDADEFSAVMKERQLASAKRLREAKDAETINRADAVLSFIYEVKLTLDKIPTIVEAEGE